jgi:hypothetical protein
MIRKWQLGLGIVGLVALVSTIGIRRRARTSILLASGDNQEVVQIREELKHIRGELNQHEAMVTFALSAANSTHAEVPSLPRPLSSAAATENVSGGTERPPIGQAAFVDQVDLMFQQEERDADWSADAERAARRQIMAQLGDGSSIRHIECRRTICKAVIVHSDEEAFHHCAQLAEHPLAEWTGIIEYSAPAAAPNGEVRVDAYLIKPGENPANEIYAQ